MVEDMQHVSIQKSMFISNTGNTACHADDNVVQIVLPAFHFVARSTPHTDCMLKQALFAPAYLLL